MRCGAMVLREKAKKCADQKGAKIDSGFEGWVDLMARELAAARIRMGKGSGKGKQKRRHPTAMVKGPPGQE